MVYLQGWHGWCHNKLLPSWHILCTQTMHHVTWCKATYARCTFSTFSSQPESLTGVPFNKTEQAIQPSFKVSDSFTIKQSTDINKQTNQHRDKHVSWHQQLTVTLTKLILHSHRAPQNPSSSVGKKKSKCWTDSHPQQRKNYTTAPHPTHLLWHSQFIGLNLPCRNQNTNMQSSLPV